MNRAEVLAAARAESAPAPVSVVTYTEAELAERAAYLELAVLARKWRRRAAAERELARLNAGWAFRAEHAPFLLTRRVGQPPLVKFTKTLQGLRPTVVHMSEHRARFIRPRNR